MKKLLLTLAALPMAAYAGGASAQTMNSGGAVGVQNRIANLEARFNSGLNAGVFTTSERNAIYAQLTELRSLERSYSMNGLTATERRALQQRIRSVRDQLRMAGGSNWANRYGWTDRELDAYAGASGKVTYDAYGRPVANNSVVYDQYGRPIATNGVVYDQYGRPIATGVYGQGGPYEPVQRNNGVGNVLGNVLGSVVGGGGGVGGLLGSVLSRGGLRTGDVITGALGSVLGSAAGMGSRYRDTSNVYYRSDGQRVYEIDARTNTVIRVYSAQP